VRGGLLFAWLIIGFIASTAHAEAFQSYATVINVQPIVETIYAPVARQVCGEPDSRAHLSKPLAATIGEDIREHKRVWRTQTDCTTVTESQPHERVTAYRVTYRYRGYTKTTRLSYHPGERMPVNVRLTPLP
jgi:uncharacterized protein YcfJ